MHSNAQVLHALLSQNAPDRRQVLEKFLPISEQMSLKNLPPFTEPIDPMALTTSSILDSVHWSWLLPTLKVYPESEQKLFLGALSPETSASLMKALHISKPSRTLTALGTSFLRQHLIDSLVGQKSSLLPIPYLPPSPLNQLLHLTKLQLLELIDILSLYDLSLEMHQILETKILKKIYSCLSGPKQRFLRSLLKKPKEPLLLSRLSLDRWDGTPAALTLLLHRRGLARLALALSKQESHLIWYICHQLDIGRGTTLEKLSLKKTSAKGAERVCKQIEEILKTQKLP